MTYLIWYLVIGVVVLLVVFISREHSTKPEPDCARDKPESDFAREIISAIHSDRKTLHSEILEKVVVPLLGTMLALALWPVAIYIKANDMLFPKKKLTLEESRLADTMLFFEKKLALEKKNNSVSKEELVRQMTVEEIELQERVIDPMGAVPDLPFGHLNTTWLRFKGNREPHDSIWTFSAQRTSDLGQKEIREGYVIVRADGIGPNFLTSRRHIEAATGRLDAFKIFMSRLIARI